MNKPTKPATEDAQELTLLGALAMALPSLEAAKKTAENAQFKQGGRASKYADLGSVLEAIRPIAEFNLWFRQVSHEAENGVSVETFYIRDREELSAGKVFVPADRSNAQGYGSAQTYARRYGLQLAFGLTTEDDDGSAAAAAPPRGAVTGQSRGDAASPDGPESRKKLAGPYTSRTALQTAVKAFVHEMNGCGDYDELHAFLHTKDNLALIEQIKRDAPDWWEGWPDQPPEFIPLSVQIERAENGFAQGMADSAADKVQAG
jgi:hypothetical protein